VPFSSFSEEDRSFLAFNVHFSATSRHRRKISLAVAQDDRHVISKVISVKKVLDFGRLIARYGIHMMETEFADQSMHWVLFSF
jgi:hypothetical protein